MNYFAGIDLGGTKIFSLIVDEKYNIIGRAKSKTLPEEGVESVINRIAESYETALQDSGLDPSKIKHIGIAVPSAVNVDKGVLLHAPNLGWKDIALSRILAERTKKPVFMDNDANMGLYAEYITSPARKYKNVYGVFVGTGIGGGYIVNGELSRGLNYTAGEIGHMIVKIGGPKCNCGNKGCLEAIAGKVGIITAIKEDIDGAKEKSIIEEISPDWRKSVGASALKKCYIKNDKVVVKALINAGKTIGIACANIVNLIGVEAIILGGGIIEDLGDVLIPIIKEYMAECSIAGGSNGVKIYKSDLGDDAIAIGAAVYPTVKGNAKYLIR